MNDWIKLERVSSYGHRYFKRICIVEDCNNYTAEIRSNQIKQHTGRCKKHWERGKNKRILENRVALLESKLLTLTKCTCKEENLHRSWEWCNGCTNLRSIGSINE